MTWVRKGGKVLKIDGLVAASLDCCCGADTPCCCPQFPDDPLGGAGPSMKFELTGYLQGSIVLPPATDLITPRDACIIWGRESVIPLSAPADECGGEFHANSTSVQMWCEGSGQGVDVTGIQIALFGGTASCRIAEPLALISATCGPPFSAEWHYVIEDIGGCECAGGSGSLLVNEVPAAAALSSPMASMAASSDDDLTEAIENDPDMQEWLRMIEGGS